VKGAPAHSDLGFRPTRPERSALPDCAIPRIENIISQLDVQGQDVIAATQVHTMHVCISSKAISNGNILL